MCTSLKKRSLPLLLSGLLLLGSLAGCASPDGEAGSVAPSDPSSPSPSVSASSQPAPAGESETPVLSSPAVVNADGACTITLSGGEVSVQGAGAAAQGGVVTVSAGGVYRITGTLDEGRIIVNAKGEEVTLLLSGADITCSYGSPIYIYKAKLATIHLDPGTENTLTDGSSYTFADTLSSAADQEPNACLYSKADLVIQGAGALTVNGNYNNGITGKDSLLLRDGSITVNAANHGVNGKDSNTLEGVTLTVTCSGDALRSTNDTDPTLGYVSITNAALTLSAGEDGIQAETWASIQGGSCTVTTGGGSTAKLSADGSARGVKAGGALSLLSGSFEMDCADDAFHSNADLTVSGGVYTVATGDDAFHADETLTVSGGTILITASYEGLEGSDVNITGGDITLTARDDGVNAAGGADGSGFLDRGGMAQGNFGRGGGDHTLTISGGSLSVLAGGDGLDANGALVLAGGDVTVYSSSAGQGDGPLDSDSGVTLSGGTLFSYGNSIFQAPSAPAQPTAAIYFDRTVAQGDQITITSGGQSWTYTLAGQANSIVFSAPQLKSGDTLTVTGGGDTLAQVTLGDGLTASGQAAAGTGMQGGKGGMGGHGGWQQFGNQDPGAAQPGRGNRVLP